MKSVFLGKVLPEGLPSDQPPLHHPAPQAMSWQSQSYQSKQHPGQDLVAICLWMVARKTNHLITKGSHKFPILLPNQRSCKAGPVLQSRASVREGGVKSLLPTIPQLEVQGGVG